MEVGIRDLRDHLSRHLEFVQSGEEVVVTDRGRAIARILPMSGERTIDRLVALGLVTPRCMPKVPSSPPITTSETVSDLVAQQRR